jgi:hypothetical protein
MAKHNLALERYRSLFSLLVAILLLSTLACSKIGWLAPRATGEPEVFASGLGQVYGLTFDDKGTLFAVGSTEGRPVVWRIDAKGEKQVWAEIVDQGDVLSDAGFALHSRQLANLAVDSSANLWITSLQHGAGFVVSEGGEVSKVYMNTYLSMSADDEILPQGVALDRRAGTLYVVTSGPTSHYSTDNEHHLSILTQDPSGQLPAQEVKTIGDSAGNAVLALPNVGTAIEQTVRGLFVGPDDKLYLIDRNALYPVDPTGALSEPVWTFAGRTLWGGVMDRRGNIYVSSNAADYDPRDAIEGRGHIDKITPQGAHEVFMKGIEQPLALAYWEGRLFIADRATQSVWVIDVP